MSSLEKSPKGNLKNSYWMTAVFFFASGLFNSLFQEPGLDPLNEDDMSRFFNTKIVFMRTFTISLSKKTHTLIVSPQELTRAWTLVQPIKAQERPETT
jgi:hypothetical protein